MMKQLKFTEIILYVSDEERSTRFYQDIFRMHPDVNVPGMTEFNLSDQCKLGLMPNMGIVRIIGDQMPHPDTGNGIPRCELYLYVEDVEFEYENAIKCRATLISPPADRDWGDNVCYFSDPDGHIIAFATKCK